MSKIKKNLIKTLSIKKILSILIIILILTWFSLKFSKALEESPEKLTTDDKFYYQLYLDNVKNKCWKYKPEKPTSKPDNYEKKLSLKDIKSAIYWDNIFEKWKKQYRDNQNSIYKCSIIQIQQNSLSLIKKELLPLEKTWVLKSSLGKKINLKETKLKSIAKKEWCKITEKEKIFSKKEVLKESTYELCKYTFYLEYLKKYFNNIERSLKVSKTQKETKSYRISQIVESHSQIQNSIENEKKHSYKVFELAYQSYIEYENNLPNHILLELIKEDFITYRKKLHETLGPLNQVLYKIVNAMNK